MPICPPFWQYGTVKTCQIKLTRKFWDVFQLKLRPVDVMTFFALHLILTAQMAEKVRASASGVVDSAHSGLIPSLVKP